MSKGTILDQLVIGPSPMQVATNAPMVNTSEDDSDAFVYT